VEGQIISWKIKKIKRIHKVDIQTKNEKDLINLGCMKNVLPRYLKIH
jgi:hypothetical protein